MRALARAHPRTSGVRSRHDGAAARMPRPPMALPNASRERLSRWYVRGFSAHAHSPEDSLVARSDTHLAFHPVPPALRKKSMVGFNVVVPATGCSYLRGRLYFVG